MLTYNQILLIIYACYLVIASITAFALYNKDKKLAVKGAMRIKEKTLLQVTVLGGSLGSLIGRKVAHHKTDKIYFSMVIYLSLLLQLAVLGLMIVLAF